MVEQVTPIIDGGSIPTTPLQISMPELYLELVPASDERFKKFRFDHYIKSYDEQHHRETKEADRLRLIAEGMSPDEAKKKAKGVHRILNAKEREALGLKTGDYGQQAHFIIWYKGEMVGIISAGSVVYTTPLRDAFFKIPKPTLERKRVLNSLVNNTVYHLATREKNMFSRVLALWEKVVPYVWFELYEVPVCGFETFVDEEETENGGRGSGYRATGWTWLGKTGGNAKTHPRESGMAKHKRDGERVSSRTYGKTTIKDVLCKWRPGHSALIPVDYKPTWEAGEKDEHGLYTAKGMAQRELARVRTAKRKSMLGKCFSATSNTVFEYDKTRTEVKPILMEPYELIRRLQLALSPDLLKPEWRDRAVNEHPTFGHCYTVTEAIYHLYGKSRGYTPHVVQVPAMDTTHWWLQNKKGDIIDGTAEQFTSKGVAIPYADGRGSGFLTKEPSKRCVTLMEKAGL